MDEFLASYYAAPSKSSQKKSSQLKIVDHDDFINVTIPMQETEETEKKNEVMEMSWKPLDTIALSPPRKQRYDEDLSPPRNQRHDDDDLSPPRKQRLEDLSPPRKQRHEDLSPPRKQRSDDDLSPPRKQRHDEDLSPPRKQRHDQDLSPPRKQRHDQDLSPPRKQRLEVSKSDSVPRLSNGTAAGLQSGAQVNSDLQRHSQQKLTLDPIASGRDAATIHRDAKSGRILSLSGSSQATPPPSKLLQDPRWLKYESFMNTIRYGLVQIRQRQQEKDQLSAVSSLPLTVTADDVTLNRTLKERTFWDDPTRHWQKKDSSSPSSSPFQYAPYRGSQRPSNRYHILPGPLWDGVERGNGFESQLFLAQNKRIAREREAYQMGAQDL